MTTTLKHRPVKCQPGDRLTRDVMRDAHDHGRHGDGSKEDVAKYWASICLDCNALWHYEYVHGLERRSDDRA